MSTLDGDLVLAVALNREFFPRTNLVSLLGFVRTSAEELLSLTAEDRM